MEILIGADPELFIKEKGSNRFVCAFNMLPGSKEKPHPVVSGAIQPDGFAAEFNIDAARTLDEFERNMVAVMLQLKEDYIGDKYELVAKPTAHFGFDYIAAQPMKARELGCEPDYNAYTEEVNPRPDGDAVDFRTGAGHIHIGWTNGADAMSPEHFQACCTLVRELDARLGIISLLWDKDKERRILYGKAGCFRPKSYGVEYRTLSNRWVIDPVLRKLVYTIAVQTVYDCANGENLISKNGFKYAYERVDTIINDNRYEYANHLLVTDKHIRELVGGELADRLINGGRFKHVWK